MNPKYFGCFLFFLLGYISFGQHLENSVNMKLSIAHTRELPYINDCSSLKKVHVIIHNQTDNIQYFYEDWNSFGYYNISFEIKKNDSIYEVVRPQKIWYRNFKSHYILNPDESLVFSYLLVDTTCSNQLFENRIFEDGWIGFPQISDTVEIRAVYQLCRLEDSIPYESIERLNSRKEDYLDYLDGDFESEIIQPTTETKKRNVPEPKKMPDTNPVLIFNEPLFSEWQQVILGF